MLAGGAVQSLPGALVLQLHVSGTPPASSGPRRGRWPREQVLDLGICAPVTTRISCRIRRTVLATHQIGDCLPCAFPRSSPVLRTFAVLKTAPPRHSVLRMEAFSAKNILITRMEATLAPQAEVHRG